MSFWQEFERLPNQITLIRILFLMPLYYFAIVGNKALFLAFFVIAALTDALDGFVARKLRAESRFGAAFDSIADLAFFWISTPIFIYLLYPEVIIKNYLLLTILFVLFLLTYAFMLLKFKRFVFMHLPSSKATVVFLFILVTSLNLFSLNSLSRAVFYIFCIIWGVSLIDILLNCIKAKGIEEVKKARSVFLPK